MYEALLHRRYNEVVESQGNLYDSVRIVQLVTLIGYNIFDSDYFSPCLGACVVFPCVFSGNNNVLKVATSLKLFNFF